MKTSASDVERLKSHLPDVLSGTAVKLVYLYGSAARDELTPLSDLDLAISTGLRMDALEHLRLEMNLETALEQFGFPQVDVREVTFAPVTFRGRIILEGRLLYCTDDDLRVRFEAATRKEYFDFLPFINQYRKTFLASLKAEISGG